jgi:translation initiation factor 2B subunit (eIF-2B alpha/beta/delta family)
MLDIEHFKKTIFDLIKNSSNTIIESYIKRLAQDTDISIESIRQDFNQYTKRNISNISERHRPNVSITNKYEFAERRLLNYFLLDDKYIRRYRSEFGPVFCIKNEVLEMQYLIEDIYHDRVTNEQETVDIKNEFIEKLNEAQLDFFNRKCINDKIELIQKEYEDMIEVMNEYQEIIQRNILEEKIKDAPTLQEKIKLATYRDIKIKEDKHGQR